MLFLLLPVTVNANTRQPPTALETQIEYELSTGSYRFCTDPNYRFWQEDKNAICPQISNYEDRCPALDAACARAPWEQHLTDEPEAPEVEFSLPEFLGRGQALVIKGLFWLGLGLGFAFLLRGVWRTLGARELEPASQGSSHRTPQTESHNRLNVPATELMQQAQDLFLEGRYHEALHFGYAAMVRALGDAGLVRPHRSTTSGEYLRMLVRHDNTEAYRELIRGLDQNRFRQKLTEQKARALLRETTDFVQKLKSTALLLVLAMPLGCSTAKLPEGPHQPTGPRGFALAESLIGERADSMTRRIRRVIELPSETTTVVALKADLRPLEWDNLRRFVSQGGHLIVAGQPRGFADAFELDIEQVPCPQPPQNEQLEVTSLRQLSGIAGPKKDIITASCGKVAFSVVRPLGQGLITMIGDTRFLENASLAASDNGPFLISLLGDLSGHVELLGPLTGKGANHPVATIRQAGLGPWIAHLLLLLTLYCWAHGRHFGRPTDPPPKGRRAFVEHAQALASHYRRKGALAEALYHYANWLSSLFLLRSGSASNDQKGIARSLGQTSQEAARLQRALGIAQNARELGSSRAELLASYRELRLAQRHQRKR